MGKEILMKYSEIDTALSQLRLSAQALDPSFPQGIKGLNVLDIMDKLSDINTKLEALLKSYQALLIKSEQMAGSSVELMREADQKLSTVSTSILK
ncbi:YwqI/YxiC family protein [Priestia megaterium]|uniref:YwqI/YxiC family protein n=1 Tax=Priestia megaterium TaxID=1404 RepID=UPI0034599F40